MSSHPAFVTLRWIGQACFVITGFHGLRILIDPPHPQVGYDVSAHSIPASAVFVSHEHFDHNYVEAAEGSPVIVEPLSSPAPDVHGGIAAPGDKPARIDYTRIFAYHDNEQGTLRGPDTMTVFDVDGLRILHMGDIGQLRLSPEQLASIGHVDVVMIPVGGFYTVDAGQAAAIVAQIKPKIVIPMHYQTPALERDLRDKLQPVSEFLRVMAPIADEVHESARDLSLDPKRLPKRLTVYVLKYQ
jgi:L-ascorbate metabolism protein UlaG (beta-lactamase superfamily)